MKRLTRLGASYVGTLFLTAIAACSGGGDDSGSSTSSASPPVAASAPIQPDLTASLIGVDANSNGVRDDIEREIATYPLDATQKATLTAYAVAMQEVYAVQDNDEDINNATSKVQQAVVCAAAKIPDADTYLDEVESSMLNTEARTRAYIAFERKLAGRALSLPSETACVG